MTAITKSQLQTIEILLSARIFFTFSPSSGRHQVELLYSCGIKGKI